jgi:VWFA-related protein
MRTRTFFRAMFCALAAVRLWSQAPASTPQVPSFRTDTHLVEVTVVVRDGRNRPVTDLTAADFQILEDGKEQEISLFSVQHQAAPAAPVSGHPAVASVSNAIGAPGGVLVILFDRLNTAWADQSQARRHIIKYLSQIAPTDRVGLYVLDSTTVSIVHDFTSDASSLLRALNRAQAHASREIAIAEEGRPSVPSSGDPGSAAVDAMLDADLERMDQMIKGDALKDRIDSTLNALEAIAHHLASIPGRKNLIWVSSAFPLSFDDGFGKRSVYREINHAARAITDADVSIYPVDARGLMGAFASPPGAKQQVFSSMAMTMPAVDSMKMLAERTGGVAYFNTNDLGGAIARAVDDSRMTYLLGYYPAKTEWDGRFRRIAVKVRRPGVNVGHRDGYLALPPPPQTSDSRQNALVRALASPLNATGLPLAVDMDRTAAGELSLTLRLDARTVRLRQTAADVWEGSVDVAIALAMPDGALAKALDITVPLRFTTVMRDQALREGLNLTRRIRPDPAAHQLRVAVRDPMSGAVGSVAITADTMRSVLGTPGK